MNITAIIIGILTIIELFFTGFGLTFLFSFPGRLMYICNTFGYGKPVKKCVKWECLAFGWSLLKVLVFKSVHFNWKYELILFIFGIVILLIEFYDETTNIYVIQDIEEKKDDEVK